MDKHLSDKLINSYPDMFDVVKKESPENTFEILCGNGWFNILHNLFEEIYAMRPNILKIKEKFGMLRINASFPSDEYRNQGWNIIRKAEEESLNVCEKCGSSGELTISNGYKYTICKSCLEKIKFASL